MSLALAPRSPRPPAGGRLVGALGAPFAVAVCYSFLTLGWHYPSDAFGGLGRRDWALLAIAEG